MKLSQGYIEHVTKLLNSFHCHIHGSWLNRNDCPHCIKLHEDKLAERDEYGFPVYDKDGVRIGSGIGYGGGQGATY